MYYLYILKNETNQFYFGQTNNLQRRLHDHNNDNGAKFVKFNGKFRLEYFEKYVDRNIAMKREKQIKKWSVAKKDALISGDFEKLVDLSKSKRSQ